MPLETLEIETGDQPKASIILMHGLGADCHDFEPLAQQLDLSRAGPVRYVFPNAPQIPVTINGGFVMPAWYDIRGADIATREDETGLRASQAAIEALVAREKSRGVPAERIVLAGFSQGAAMALMTGLRHGERLAGIVGAVGCPDGRRAQCCQSANPHPAGPWPSGRCRADRPRHCVARCAGGAGLYR